MKTYDVVLLTQKEYENPVPDKRDWFVENVLLEDGLVQKALEQKGLKVIRKDWASEDFDWTTTQTALFRTTWDYFHRFDEFSSWLEKVSKETRLINPAKQIRWNIDKHYLADLEQQGINIIPTFFIEKGTKTSLESIHKAQNWSKTILKPAVSGAARHTYKLNPDVWEAHETIFQELIAQEAMLLQPFQEDIVKTGEVSAVVIGGKFTHAVLKVAKKGDFRVQDDWGGTVHDYRPSVFEIEFAEQVVTSCNPQPLYARVDYIKDNTGKWAIVELELVEPELWFRKNEKAAERFADVIVKDYFK